MVNPRAERARHELGPEADPQRRPPGREAFLEQDDLFAEKRVSLLFIGPDGAAEHDDKIALDRVKGSQFVEANLAVTDCVSGPHEDALEASQVFEIEMADRYGGLEHGGLSFFNIGIATGPARS